jgi:Protein of unknown function (DUF3551)
MRLLLAALGILVGVAGISDRAQAQNYPWCAVYGNGFGGRNCGFSTFEQCEATISGIGGFCSQNTQYQAPTGTAARRPHKKRKHVSHDQP